MCRHDRSEDPHTALRGSWGPRTACIPKPASLRQRSMTRCHNCRRQRLKCDQTQPQCRKCSNRGEQCLGYGQLFRWETGIASRGKMAGVRFDEARRNDFGYTGSHKRSLSPASIASSSSRSGRSSSLKASVTDPILQDLDSASRKYLAYCG
jgi:hypothetical protein